MSAFFDLHRNGARPRGAVRVVVIVVAIVAVLLMLMPLAAAQGKDKLRGGAYSIKTFYLSNPDILEHLPALLRKGRHDHALKRVEALISVVETDPMAPFAYHAYTALCVTETARADYTRALKACNRALSYRPGYWEAMNNRGALHYVSGNTDGARADFATAALTAPAGDAAGMVARNLAAATGNRE